MSEPPVFVVGYRLGPTGLAALGYARWLAEAVNGRLRVVHVTDLDDYPVDPDDLDWEAGAEHRLAAVRSEVEAALASYLGEWAYETAHGDPGDALADIAVRQDAELVVIASHVEGRIGRLHRLVARSIVRELFDRAECPVLVVPCRENR